MQKKKLDWNEYHKYIDRLADIIVKSGKKYKYIFADSKDDLLVAVHLSHKLKTNIVTDISLITFLINIGEQDPEILVVSNVVETGDIFLSLKKQIDTPFDTAVIFKDVSSLYEPSFCVETPQDYIVFPWEQ